MDPSALEDFVRRLPKAELHLHIEGSLEPEMMFALAARRGISLPYASVEAVRNAYRFHNLHHKKTLGLLFCLDQVEQLILSEEFDKCLLTFGSKD